MRAGSHICSQCYFLKARPLEFGGSMPRAKIVFAFRNTEVWCDGRCDLAKGINPPRESTVEYAGVWSLDNYKHFPNKWCVRECDRCHMLPYEESTPLKEELVKSEVIKVEKVKDKYDGWVPCCYECPNRDVDQDVCYDGKSYEECPKYKQEDYFDWIKKNVEDKSLVVVIGMTSEALAKRFNIDRQQADYIVAQYQMRCGIVQPGIDYEAYKH